MSNLPVVPHWINGQEVFGRGGTTMQVTDPALGIETKQLNVATDDEVEAAFAAADKAFAPWRDLSQARKQAIMFKFRELLNSRKGELAEIITSEHGKVFDDALGEVTRGQEVVEFACGMPHLLKGSYSENVSTNVDVYSTRQALGPVGIIGPFNFPAMVPMWFFPVAIAAGNTVVIKPSEKVPSAMIWMAKILKEAGLPDGVFNVVNGNKETVQALLEDSRIKAISFVGSTPVAKYIYEEGSKHGKRVQALGGAKNHMLVLPDADLDLVADSAVNAGFGSAGERCMAISVVLAVEPVADALIEKLKERMAKLRTGDGRRGCDMGPLVTKEHRDKVAGYIAEAEKDGGRIIVDGRVGKYSGSFDGADEGFWLAPTLIDNVPLTSKAYTEEIFGPVLNIVRVKSYEEGVNLINSGRFGNGTAIFTNDGGAARRFQYEIEVGMVGINVPVPVPVAYYSFGGWKESLFGDTKAHGVEGVKFFTREKTMTSRWLDPSHGGINLGFPQN
jgi:malonate-semialdehyde dehydrogenase (acetylating)/methylmalonate-semialdehyde dehydrogenase